MTDDLFEGTAAEATSTKKCLVCGASAVRPWVMCAPCKAYPVDAMQRLAAEVDALDEAWRTPLRESSDATQERFVGVLAAQSEAYGPGDNRSRRRRILAFRSRLSKTKTARGEIATIAAAYEAWLVRAADLELVAMVVMMGKSGQDVANIEEV